MKRGFKDHQSRMDTWHRDHRGPHPSLASAALLPAGDVAPGSHRSPGNGSAGASWCEQHPEPRAGKSQSLPGFLPGVDRPSCFL